MRIKEILNSKQIGRDYLKGDDLRYVLSILRNHTEFEVKQGSGIFSIFSDKTKYGNRCFFIERTDGTIVDISYTHALKPKSKLDDIKAACRTSIRPIIVDFARKHYNGFCEVTKKAITLNEMHVDHYNKTFIQLFNEWIKDKDLDCLHNLVNKSDDKLCVDTFFTDQNIIDDFVNYHNNNTNLRCVSKTFNLSRNGK
jgi:hypothetical protein